MTKIAIFGGSFDPVHIAHTNIVKEALKMSDIAKVILVPAYTPPHKKQQFADVDHRVVMLKLAIKDIKNAEISFFEMEKQGVVYSYQTLDYFKELYPEYEITMIIGSDSLKELDTWKNVEYLISQYRFLVAKRPDIIVDANMKYKDCCVFMDMMMKDISSTQVRQLLKEDSNKAKKFLNRKVYDYIKEYGLYK